MSSLHKGSSIISISGNEAYDIAIQQGFALLDKPINDRRLKLALLNDQSGALATFGVGYATIITLAQSPSWPITATNNWQLTKVKNLSHKPNSSLTSSMRWRFIGLVTWQSVTWRYGLAWRLTTATLRLMRAVGYSMPSKRISLCGNRNFMPTVKKVCGWVIMVRKDK